MVDTCSTCRYYKPMIGYPPDIMAVCEITRALRSATDSCERHEIPPQPLDVVLTPHYSATDMTDSTTQGTEGPQQAPGSTQAVPGDSLPPPKPRRRGRGKDKRPRRARLARGRRPPKKRKRFPGDPEIGKHPYVRCPRCGKMLVLYWGKPAGHKCAVKDENMEIRP